MAGWLALGDRKGSQPYERDADPELHRPIGSITQSRPSGASPSRGTPGRGASVGPVSTRPRRLSRPPRAREGSGGYVEPPEQVCEKRLEYLVGGAGVL